MGFGMRKYFATEFTRVQSWCVKSLVWGSAGHMTQRQKQFNNCGKIAIVYFSRPNGNAILSNYRL